MLQYFGTLLTRGKLNAFESLELSRLVLNQNKKNLLENWLAEDKLECSEELGDLVKTVDNDLALKIYIKARATPKVVAAFVERREFDKILIYSKQVGYTPDYMFLLQTILRTDSQSLVEFFGTLSREWALECMKDLLLVNLRGNLHIIVQDFISDKSLKWEEDRRIELSP